MTETQTLTLADFLLARIADDEAHAREAAGDPWRIRSTPWGKTFDIVADDRDSRADHWFCVDPARVLAEVEAKRRIVAWDAEQPVDRGVLNILALPYADHPDFREEWRA